MGFLEPLLFQNYIYPIIGWVSIALMFYWSTKASTSQVFHDLNDAGVQTRLAFVIFTGIATIWNIAQPFVIDWNHDNAYSHIAQSFVINRNYNNAYSLVPYIFPYIIIGGIAVITYVLIHQILRWVVWNGTAELHYSIFKNYDKATLSKKINQAVKESTDAKLFERIQKIDEDSKSVIEFWQKVQNDPDIDALKLYRSLPSSYDTSHMSRYELNDMLDINQKYNYAYQK